MKSITYTNFYQVSLDEVKEVYQDGNRAYTTIKRERFEIIHVSEHGYLLYKLNERYDQ
jgi:hypothetical protein